MFSFRTLAGLEL